MFRASTRRGWLGVDIELLAESAKFGFVFLHLPFEMVLKLQILANFETFLLDEGNKLSKSIVIIDDDLFARRFANMIPDLLTEKSRKSCKELLFPERLI